MSQTCQGYKVRSSKKRWISWQVCSRPDSYDSHCKTRPTTGCNSNCTLWFLALLKLHNLRDQDVPFFKLPRPTRSTFRTTTRPILILEHYQITNITSNYHRCSRDVVTKPKTWDRDVISSRPRRDVTFFQTLKTKKRRSIFPNS